MENPIKIDDLGVPLFLETPKHPLKQSTVKLIFWMINPHLKNGETREPTNRKRWKTDFRAHSNWFFVETPGQLVKRVLIGQLHPGRLTAGTYSHHPFRKENDLPNLHDCVPC